MVVVTGKVPSNCCVGSMLSLKKVTLESINDPIPSLFHKFHVAQITFQAGTVNKVVALEGAIPNGIVGFFLLVSFL